MADITNRLRDRSFAHKARDPLCEEAADEIDRLREAIRRLAEQDATLSVVGGNATVETGCPYVVGRTTLHCSLTPFTITAEEREAIQTAMNAYGENNDDRECEMIEAALWGLLERTK